MAVLLLGLGIGASIAAGVLAGLHYALGWWERQITRATEPPQEDR